MIHILLIFVIIMVIGVNHVIMFFRTKKYIRTHFNLKRGYDRFLIRSLVFSIIPWLWLLASIAFNKTEALTDIFQLSELNLFTGLFLAYYFILFALISFWILMSDGADFFRKYPGIIMNNALYNPKKMLTIIQTKRIWIIKVLLLAVIFSILCIINHPTLQFSGLLVILILFRNT